MTYGAINFCQVKVLKLRHSSRWRWPLMTGFDLHVALSLHSNLTFLLGPLLNFADMTINICEDSRDDMLIWCIIRWMLLVPKEVLRRVGGARCGNISWLHSNAFADDDGCSSSDMDVNLLKLKTKSKFGNVFKSCFEDEHKHWNGPNWVLHLLGKGHWRELSEYESDKKW